MSRPAAAFHPKNGQITIRLGRRSTGASGANPRKLAVRPRPGGAALGHGCGGGGPAGLPDLPGYRRTTDGTDLAGFRGGPATASPGGGRKSNSAPCAASARSRTWLSAAQSA